MPVCVSKQEALQLCCYKKIYGKFNQAQNNIHLSMPITVQQLRSKQKYWASVAKPSLAAAEHKTNFSFTQKHIPAPAARASTVHEQAEILSIARSKAQGKVRGAGEEQYLLMHHDAIITKTLLKLSSWKVIGLTTKPNQASTQNTWISYWPSAPSKPRALYLP